MCRLLAKSILRRKGKFFAKFQIDPNKCKKCLSCIEKFACPAIIKKGDRVYIKEDMCWGCGVCSQICPQGAIIPVRRKK